MNSHNNNNFNCLQSLNFYTNQNYRTQISIKTTNNDEMHLKSDPLQDSYTT